MSAELGAVAIQRTLIALGHDVGKSGPDGQIGPDTTAAIRALQGRLRLPVTGTFDSPTRRLAALELLELVNALLGGSGP